MQAPAVNTVRATSDRSSLMSIGRKVDYAVRALSYLAAQPAAVGGGQQGDRGGGRTSPRTYMSKIMKDLAAAGLVHSHVGRNGGFSLARHSGVHQPEGSLRGGGETA